ncbi:hypothetical protein [Fodinibius salsisoli]|uniref:DoxX protein n=1 Tax=Fodinibius salsisoli TaxID=2820877 RepID=A0ABT3PKU2_9BACT|nr:hypothetical protein [Fodinibius salsisoli]MCW9706393.1 hypothetical protein [Fodinibius salsisoli]
MSKILVTSSRILLGLIFLIFGLNGFYTFIPVPEFHPFMEILVSSGYIYIIKTFEVVAGLLLLSNRFMPLALALLSPIVVNIIAYHIFLDSRNWFIAPLLLLLTGILVFHYWHYFRSIFSFKAEINAG